MKRGDRIDNWTVIKTERQQRQLYRNTVTFQLITAKCKCGYRKTVPQHQVKGMECRRCRYNANPIANQATMEAFERACAMVEEMTGVTRDAIIERDRSASVSAARKMVAILMVEAGFSLPQTGAAMDRNHTSVLRMCAAGKLNIAAGIAARFDAEKRRAAVARIADRKAAVKEFVKPNAPQVIVLRDHMAGMKLAEYADAPATDRELFDQLCVTLPILPVQERKNQWLMLCKRLWPVTWQQQYNQPPKGILIEPQEVLAM